MSIGINIDGGKRIGIENATFYNVERPIVMNDVEDVHLSGLRAYYGSSSGEGDYNESDLSKSSRVDGGSTHSTGSSVAYGSRAPRTLGAGGFIVKKLSAMIWRIYG